MALYRDDNAALQAKVAELEGELAATRAHVDRLKGGGSDEKRRKKDSLVGAPVRHVDGLELDGVVSDAGCEAIARVIEARLGLRTSTAAGTVKGQAVGWTAAEGKKAFTLERAGDTTTLRLETDAQALPIVVALGPVLGGLSSLPFALWQMNLLHHFEPGEDLWTTVGIAAISTVLGGWLTRGWAKRRALALEQAHDGAWATVTEIATERRDLKVRVATADDSEERAEPAAIDDEASARSRGA
jgi:hypothetical protein